MLDIRKDFFTAEVIRHWNRLLGDMWGHCPWRCSGQGWLWSADRAVSGHRGDVGGLFQPRGFCGCVPGCESCCRGWASPDLASSSLWPPRGLAGCQGERAALLCTSLGSGIKIGALCSLAVPRPGPALPSRRSCPRTAPGPGRSRCPADTEVLGLPGRCPLPPPAA